MEKPELPIDKMSAREFNNTFKKKHLDKTILDPKSLKEIKKLFGIGSKKVADVSCDEAHVHGYECIFYKSPLAGVVERLVDEIKKYQEVMGGLQKEITLYAPKKGRN